MFRTSHLLFKLALAALVVAGLLLVYLDARITATFSDKMWELAARVYARPLELFAGADLTPEELVVRAGSAGVSHGHYAAPAGRGVPQQQSL